MSCSAEGFEIVDLPVDECRGPARCTQSRPLDRGALSRWGWVRICDLLSVMNLLPGHHNLGGAYGMLLPEQLENGG